jgi:multidrug transporter EmrE-like cation transporter
MFPLILPSILSIIAGVLIFVYPRLLSQIVALYLIIVGVLGLVPLFFA